MQYKAGVASASIAEPQIKMRPYTKRPFTVFIVLIIVLVLQTLYDEKYNLSSNILDKGKL